MPASFRHLECAAPVSTSVEFEGHSEIQHQSLPEELEREIGLFVDYYNNERVHESLDNVTPADVYHGRHREILAARQQLKAQTLGRRRWYNQGYELGDEELIRPSAIRECVY